MSDWIEAGPVLAASEAERRTVASSAGPILLVSLEEGWVAVADACTHAQCPFSSDGSVEDGVVICGCHGAEFDLRTGAVLRGPARLPLATYPVRIVGDRLEVAVTVDRTPEGVQ